MSVLRRFWNLPHKVKWPIIGVVAVVVISIIAAASGGGSDDNPKQTDSASATGAASSTTAATTAAAAKATNTPKPTDTPKPTATPKPTETPKPPTPTPEPAGFSFGSGKKLVGTDLAAGVTYRTRSASDNCYWERLSGLGGTLGEIIANDNASGPAVVAIGASDKAFNSSRCAKWTQDLSAITKSPTDPFKGDGTYIVGVDIAPGTWRADNPDDRCYWERMSGFGGAGVGEIIANDNVKGSAIVAIAAADKGFKSSHCGTWTLVQ